MELAAAENDWKAVRAAATDLAGVNPLIAPPHRYAARAAEALGERAPAIEAWRTLLLLDPLDLADHHYRLAKLLAEDNQLPAAKQEVIRALEEAPRFRDAHRLLLEIVEKLPASPSPVATAPSTAPTPPATPTTVGPSPAPTQEPQP